MEKGAKPDVKNCNSSLVEKRRRRVHAAHVKTYRDTLRELSAALRKFNRRLERERAGKRRGRRAARLMR